MKLQKRLVSVVSAGFMIVGLALIISSLPVNSWYTYAPPPANPEFELVRQGNVATSTWYYDRASLWTVFATRVDSGVQCQFILGFNCLMRVFDMQEDCNQAWIPKRFDPLTDITDCDKFNAVRALSIASTLMAIMSALFLSITMGKSSPAHSLAAGVTLIFAATLGFSASMIAASLKTLEDFDGDVFTASFGPGFSLLLSGSMLLFVSAAIALLVAEKGKKRENYMLADLDDEDDRGVNVREADDVINPEATPVNMAAAAAAATFNASNA